MRSNPSVPGLWYYTTCHVAYSGGATCKWVLLADMVDDVAATSAMTWQRPTMPCGRGYPMRGCHMAVLTYICAGVRGCSPLRTLSRWDRASILGVPGQYGFSLVDGGMHVRREWVRSSGAVAVTGAKELGRNVGDNCEEEKDKRRIARRMKLKIAGALTVGYVDRSEK
ncbi:hypothetical protein Tco_0284755 [Tanacetum coccineum]